MSNNMQNKYHEFFKNVYVMCGYEDREHYLAHLAKEYKVPHGTILELAETLGPEEDFDGLLEALGVEI